MERNQRQKKKKQSCEMWWYFSSDKSVELERRHIAHYIRHYELHITRSMVDLATTQHSIDLHTYISNFHRPRNGDEKNQQTECIYFFALSSCLNRVVFAPFDWFLDRLNSLWIVVINVRIFILPRSLLSSVWYVHPISLIDAEFASQSRHYYFVLFKSDDGDDDEK